MAKKKKKNKRSPIRRLAELVIVFVVSTAAICLILNMFIQLLSVSAISKGSSASLSAAMSPKLSYLYKAPRGMPIYTPLLIGYIVAMVICIRLEQKYQIKHSQDELYGTSRWSDIKDIKKEFFRIPEKSLSSADKSGIPLAYIDGCYYIDATTTHSLIIGTTRSGKTQTFVLPFINLLASCQNIDTKQSMVINDPKGEILENTYAILKQNGYKVVVLNLRDTDRTNCWNPLSFIIDEYVYAKENHTDMSKVNDYIDTMANTLTYNPDTDPIWPSSAKSLLKAMILYLLDLGYENNCLDKVNMYSVYQLFIEYGGDDETKIVNGAQVTVNKLDQLFKSLPIGSPAKAAYATSKFASGDMRSSIFATLADNISIFGSDEGIASLTAGNDIRFDDLVDNEQPTAIFMVVPDDRPTRHVIASLFINQCYTAMVEYLNRNRIQALPRRVNFILDEFCNMVRIPGMDNKITVSAGRNILFHLFVQDLSQLDIKYKDEAKVIRPSCGNLIYIYSMDPDTNEFISRTLGNETKEYISYSGSLKEFISQQSYQAKDRALMTADELSVMEYGETVIKRQRMYPIKSTFEFFYKSGHKITKLDDIVLSEKRVALSKVLFDFELINNRLGGDKSKDSYASYISSRPLSSPGARRQTSSNTKQNPMKLAIEEADRLSNGEFSTLISQNEYSQCETILKRFKAKRSLDTQTILLLQNYLSTFVNH